MRKREGRVGNGEAKVSDSDSLSDGIASGKKMDIFRVQRGTKSD